MRYLLGANFIALFTLNLIDYPFNISINSNGVRIKYSTAPSISLRGSKPTSLNIIKDTQIAFSLSNAYFPRPGRNIRKQ